MDKITEYSIFSLSSFKSINNTVLFNNDDMMLFDNLDSELHPERKFSDPVKCTCLVCVICVTGTCRFKINWEEETLTENSVLLITPDSICECLEVSSDFKLVCVAFASKFCLDGVDASAAMLFHQYISSQSVTHLSGQMIEYIIQAYTRMRLMVENPTFLYKDKAIGGFLQIMAAYALQWISDYYAQNKEDEISCGRQQTIFKDFLNLVRTHSGQERMVKFYADKLNMTPKYLSHVIYTVSHRYAVDWIRDSVIFEAKALLRSRQYSVQQVAYQLNFANASFFGKFFKNAVGCTPRKFMVQ